MIEHNLTAHRLTCEIDDKQVEISIPRLMKYEM